MKNFHRYIAAAFLGAAVWTAIAHWHDTAARADATYSYTATAPRFIVRSLMIGTTCQTARLDATTGDAWYASNGKWVKYTEDATPGAGTYDLQLFSMPDGKSYLLYRSDLNTGRTWYLNGTKFSLITEP